MELLPLITSAVPDTPCSQVSTVSMLLEMSARSTATRLTRLRSSAVRDGVTLLIPISVLWIRWTDPLPTKLARLASVSSSWGGDVVCV